ncbi:sensor histidine kinase [Oceanispirochaeta sp.]|jgi:two-component system sensor histidine kinase YesM|uniref:sensor histidine kinase n=1 Tax=Oceanispirochaeta sp. TaxID=2035350 RepID=UPI0026289DD4|nr:sensor histidine kinase [Oceanispirochaeta sp.]MDA3958369.1 sensor histidine kinase [Oceanispirochaeta sp.]
MKKALSFGTLESRIYTIFTVMIFSAIFVMQLVSFRYTIDTVKSTTIDSNRVVLHQLVSQMDSYIQGMEHISQAVTVDDQIQMFLTTSAEDSGKVEMEDTIQFIRQKLQNYIQAREDISDILLIRMDRFILTSSEDVKINPWTAIQDKDWFIDAVEVGNKTIVSSSYVQNLIWGRYSWVVSLSKGILSKEDGILKGILLVDLKFNRIKDLCQSLVIGQKGYNFILDNEGNYVFHPTQQLVYSNIKSEPLEGIMAMIHSGEIQTYQRDERYYMVETSQLTGWHVVSVIYESDIITEWKSLQLIYTLIGLVLFLIVGLATNKISSGITKPVRKLQEIMQTVETGEFRVVGSIKATDEIRELAREYDIMVGRIRELMDANTREQELKRKSDLKALQAQINPHFLYNTLDSIIWMGEMKQNEKVVQMTSALSKLFRISISKGRDLISIRNELEHVKSYLTIQEMRYQDKFRYEMNMDPEILDMTTLKITLQPLVENAIYHGIKEVDHEGLISISGWLEDDVIVLEVRDNGIGMNEAQLALLVEGLERSDVSAVRLNRQGLGVRNVHERIQLYFGKEYGLVCESSPGVGTCISVRFPASSLEVVF